MLLFRVQNSFRGAEVLGWLGYLLKNNNNTRKQQNNKQTNNPHKDQPEDDCSPSKPLWDTFHSCSFFGEGEARSPSRGATQTLPPGISHPCRVRQVPAPALPSSKSGGCGAGPRGVGYAPLRLSGTSGGDFSEGCPCQPPLDGGPMCISRGNPILGGL